MATSGTSGTAKWTLSNGVLTISPSSGSSGYLYADVSSESWLTNSDRYLESYLNLTDDEHVSVTSIVFTGSIRLKYKKASMLGGTETGFLADFGLLFSGFSNLTSVDVRGLNSVGVTDFGSMFAIETLADITGLSSLDTSSAKDYSYMFKGCKITSVDCSNFANMNVEGNTSNPSTTNIACMFNNMPFCTSITLPSNFRRTNSAYSYVLGNEWVYYHLDIAKTSSWASDENIVATNESNGISVSSDEDFFSLPAGSQGGTWLRTITSQQPDLTFRVTSRQRTGRAVAINYRYSTTVAATVELYVKLASASSYPNTAEQTITLAAGSGTGTITYNCPTDDAYDFQIIVSDGTTNLYTYTSIDSNILLLAFGKNFEVYLGLDVDSDASESVAATSGTDMDLFNAIRNLGWYSDVIV